MIRSYVLYENSAFNSEKKTCSNTYTIEVVVKTYMKVKIIFSTNMIKMEFFKRNSYALSGIFLELFVLKIIETR